MDNLIGKRLDGRYQIEELIGVGGMANVYKALDLKEERVVAVKILRQEFMDNEDLVRRFKNESKAICVLNHSNIVKVYDVSVSDKLQFIVMEYIDGITLKEYMEQRGEPLTYREALHFVGQVLLALQHAHEMGIVHRDIKPQNIMLLADGSIKVMDFGIARFSRSESQTMTDKAIGSVHYISPEQAKGDVTDPKADIYSVGVMLYEMLSGKLPFESDSPVSVAIKQISDTPTPVRELNPAVPEALAAITERAMAKDAAERYQSAREMLGDIEEFKRNPSVRFEYKYLSDSTPTRYIDKVANKSTQKQQTNKRSGTAAKSGGSVARRKRSYTLPVLVGMAVAFAVGAIILVLLIFKFSGNPLFSDKQDVDLPDFNGMRVEDVKAGVANGTYPFDIQYDEQYVSDKEAGVIYDQTPKAPKQVKEGAKVTLRVSLGAQMIAVPEVTGWNRNDGEAEIKKQGFTVMTKPEESETVTEGKIIRTDPVAGTQVEAGGTITVYFSQKRPETETTVPNCLGTDEAGARIAIEAKGLTVGNIIMEDNEMPAGTVIAQQPEADTLVKKGAKVNLKVSTGVVENTRTVYVNFTNAHAGEWYIALNGVAQALGSSTDGQSGQFSVQFKNRGTGTIEVSGPNVANQSATIDFTNSGGDISFNFEGSYTPPSSSGEWDDDIPPNPDGPSAG